MGGQLPAGGLGVGFSSSSSRVRAWRSVRRTDSAKNRSNSATRTGCSAVGSVHESGTQSLVECAIIVMTPR